MTRLRWTLLVLLGLTLIRMPQQALLQLLLPAAEAAPELNYMVSIAQSLLLFALPGWLLMRGERPEPIGNRRLTDWLLAAVPAAVLARLALSSLNLLWSGLLGLDTPAIPQVHGMAGRVLQVLALAVAPAVAEEIFFRGALLRNLQKQYGKHTALWLTTLLFALMHGSVGGLPGHLGISLLLTLLALHSGSLAVPVLVHLIYNLLPFYLQGGALGALLLLAGLLAVLIRRVPAGGSCLQGRESLLAGAILAVMTLQYVV